MMPVAVVVAALLDLSTAVGSPATTPLDRAEQTKGIVLSVVAAEPPMPPPAPKAPERPAILPVLYNALAGLQAFDAYIAMMIVSNGTMAYVAVHNAGVLRQQR